jgi:hypothetical protein
MVTQMSIYDHPFFHQDNSCASDSHKDGTNSYLDVELDSIRRKLESVSTLVLIELTIFIPVAIASVSHHFFFQANKESENLQREMSSLENQTVYKRKHDSAFAEIQKLFDDKVVQKKFEGMTLYSVV